MVPRLVVGPVLFCVDRYINDHMLAGHSSTVLQQTFCTATTRRTPTPCTLLGPDGQCVQNGHAVVARVGVGWVLQLGSALLRPPPSRLCDGFVCYQRDDPAKGRPRLRLRPPLLFPAPCRPGASRREASEDTAGCRTFTPPARNPLPERQEQMSKCMVCQQFTPMCDGSGDSTSRQPFVLSIPRHVFAHAVRTF